MWEFVTLLFHRSQLVSGHLTGLGRLGYVNETE